MKISNYSGVPHTSPFALFRQTYQDEVVSDVFAHETCALQEENVLCRSHLYRAFWVWYIPVSRVDQLDKNVVLGLIYVG